MKGRVAQPPSPAAHFPFLSPNYGKAVRHRNQSIGKNLFHEDALILINSWSQLISLHFLPRHVVLTLLSQGRLILCLQLSVDLGAF
jgi:hypothetical protein